MAAAAEAARKDLRLKALAKLTPEEAEAVKGGE
jgi:hypothetical protein